MKYLLLVFLHITPIYSDNTFCLRDILLKNQADNKKKLILLKEYKSIDYKTQVTSCPQIKNEVIHIRKLNITVNSSLKIEHTNQVEFCDSVYFKDVFLINNKKYIVSDLIKQTAYKDINFLCCRHTYIDEIYTIKSYPFIYLFTYKVTTINPHLPDYLTFFGYFNSKNNNFFLIYPDFDVYIEGNMTDYLTINKEKIISSFMQSDNSLPEGYTYYYNQEIDILKNTNIIKKIHKLKPVNYYEKDDQKYDNLYEKY